MKTSTAWIYLVTAGVLEIVWALGLKSTQGFSRLAPSAAVLSVMALSFYLLSQALKGLPIGTAYAVWTGIGAAGTALAGMLLLKEPFSVLKLLCVVLIVTGIAGLKIFS